MNNTRRKEPLKFMLQILELSILSGLRQAEANIEITFPPAVAVVAAELLA